MSRMVIAGIGTGVGKTFISAIVTEALEADYWKPVQAGNLDYTDTDVVRELTSNSKSEFHSEAYRLSQPLSPHAAAEIDGIEIKIEKLKLPQTENKLVIELAGGLMVPLNSKELNIDLIKKWEAPVILVSQNYLGSINHTLLSVNILQSNNIKIAGIIFNGARKQSTEEFILEYTQLNCLCRIDYEQEINKALVKKYASELKDKLISI